MCCAWLQISVAQFPEDKAPAKKAPAKDKEAKKPAKKE